MAFNSVLNKFVSFGLLLCIAPMAHGQGFMANIQGRKHQNLNGKWPVIVDWYDNGISNGIFHTDTVHNSNLFIEYRFAGSNMNVLGDCGSQLPELKYHEGSVWYNRTDNYPRSLHKRAYLYFAGVNYETDGYLNGEEMGCHEGGFTPFETEVTSKIKGGQNDLILRVNNQRRADDIPALSFDWWNYGGITRDVSLLQKSETFIEDYAIKLKKNSKDEILGWIKLDGSIKQGYVTLEIPVAYIKQQFKTDNNSLATFRFKANLQLRSPQKRNLYAVNISSATDTIKNKIGFRNIEVSGTQIFLNGSAVFLKGVNFHEEIAQGERRASTDADSKQLLLQAKELGCKSIRPAHYPQNEHTGRLAEEMGFILWEEIPEWQGTQFTNPLILNKSEAILKEMVTGDKNRCGIIIWSLSNETVTSPAINKVLKDMAAIYRGRDSTDLVSSAFDHFKYEGNKMIIDDELIASLDVIAANKYMGWYTKWPDQPGNVVWESCFNKPLNISEFGGEALYGQNGTTDDTSGWND